MGRTNPTTPSNKFWHGGFHISTSPIDGQERLAFLFLNTAKRVARERTNDGFPCIFRQCRDTEEWEVVKTNDV
jgi:hypothetical protein